MDVIQIYFITLLLAAARLLPLFLILPILTFSGIQTGILRMGIIIGLSFFVAPIVYFQIGAIFSAEALFPTFLSVIFNELLVGIALALSSGLPFWVAISVGNIIDTQAGTQMSNIIIPGSGEETTPYGNFMIIVIIIIFLQLGLMEVLIIDVYAKSYLLWPIQPKPFTLSVDYLLLASEIISSVFLLGIVFAFPFIIGLAVIDIGLAFTSRLSPSLNPFFLSMSLKQLYVLTVFLLYLPFLVELLSGLISQRLDLNDLLSF